MALRDVDLVVRMLLASAQLRECFTANPAATLVGLLLSTELELTVDEMRALLRTHPTIWNPKPDPIGLVFN